MNPAITVDEQRCCGYGECVLNAPTLFRLGDDSVSRPTVSELTADQMVAARAAAALCPSNAISVA